MQMEDIERSTSVALFRVMSDYGGQQGSHAAYGLYPTTCFQC